MLENWTSVMNSLDQFLRWLSKAPISLVTACLALRAQIAIQTNKPTLVQQRQQFLKMYLPLFHLSPINSLLIVFFSEMVEIGFIRFFLFFTN